MAQQNLKLAALRHSAETPTDNNYNNVHVKWKEKLVLVCKNRVTKHVRPSVRIYQCRSHWTVFREI
jgi:hypothetical protein